jgi:hypothetical protein
MKIELHEIPADFRSLGDFGSLKEQVTVTWQEQPS